MKKILKVTALSILVLGLLTACGSNGVTDETWNTLRSRYSELVSNYNTMKDLYDTGEFGTDEEFEEILKEGQETIDEVGAYERESLEEEDALSLIDAINQSIEALDQQNEEMSQYIEENNTVDEDTYSDLVDLYNDLVKVYNAVREYYLSDGVAQSDEIEALLHTAESEMEDISGRIDSDDLTNEDALALMEQMNELNTKLGAVVE